MFFVMSNSRFVQIIYYPLVVFGALFVHFLLARSGLIPEIVPTLVATGVLALVLFSERRMPFCESWLVKKSKYEMVVDASSTLIMLPVIMMGCEFFWKNMVPHLDLWPEEAPLMARIVLAVLVAEFFFYWIHRLSHEVGILWRFHSVHHSVKRVYWLNSGRLHPVDAFLNFFVYFFSIIVMGVDQEVFLIFLTLTMTTGVLEHANVNFRAGYLNYVFNTAELHRWHHSTNIEISKKNCGKILSVWDIVFGTFYFPKHFKDIENVGVDG